MNFSLQLSYVHSMNGGAVKPWWAFNEQYKLLLVDNQ